MPKPHFSKAPPHVVTAAELHRQNVNVSTPSGPMPIRAVGTLAWMRAYYARGYDVPPADVPCPAMRELEAFDGSDVGLAALRVRLSVELEHERYCLREAHSRRAWAAAPSSQEEAEVARAERERQAREQALEARTAEILASEEAKRTEGARKKARAEAEKEALS
jgi:hypothetical protein